MHAYRMLLIYCRQFVLDLANAWPRPHLLCCWPLDRMACPSSHRGNHHLLHPHEHPHALECQDDGRLQEDTWVVSERAQTSGNPQPQEASNCPCITKNPRGLKIQKTVFLHLIVSFQWQLRRALTCNQSWSTIHVPFIIRNTATLKDFT